MTATRAIRIHKIGGPDQLQWEPVEVPSPGPGQAVVAQTAAGLNFIDVYHRTGLYPGGFVSCHLGQRGRRIRGSGR